MMTAIQGMWKAFLRRIAEQNKKQFGTGRMDCCEVNRKPIVKK